ncbi:MAG TPA: TolC family protein [Verrucomicrobiae bacterium]|nr:TolC family protein [Verrucomicrobiae bacterium]
MTQRWSRFILALYLAASLATGVPAYAQAPAAQQEQAPAQTNAGQVAPASNYTTLLTTRNYTKGKRSFPNIFAPYTGRNIAHPDLTNAPTVYSLIQDGKLNLSLQDAIALALQNDLDIGVAEYTPWIDQTNVLQAEGGGTPQGQFVIGAGGGGSFDPVISLFSSISDASQTVNNPLTSGVGSTSAQNLTQTTHTNQVDLSYTQEFHTGTLFNVQLNNTRSSSSPSANLFNPSVDSNLIVQLQQPLLRGFGLLPNTRFILEARNTDRVGELQFEEQVITSVTQVQTQYWNLVFDRQAVDVAKQTLAYYQKLYDDDERLLKIGSGTPSDVVFAESFIASGNQALLGAQSAEQIQQSVLLNLLTKDPSDPRLKGLEIVPTTPLENAPQVPNITADDAVKEAWANRPELKVDDLLLRNDDIDVRATHNSLLPSLNVAAEYISLGLSGNAVGAFIPNGTLGPSTTVIVDQAGNPVLTGTGGQEFVGVPLGTIGPGTAAGLHQAYSQIFHNVSPTYAGSLNFNLPLRNRSAQAANANAQLAERRDQTIHQRNRSSIYSAAREAFTQINLAAAQVDAAVKATGLAQESYDYEVKKFNLGQSNTFLVVQYASILNGAKLGELQAKTLYEIALANFNQVLGRTLTANNITIANNRFRDINLLAPVPLIPGTLDGRLLGDSTSSTEMQ